MTEEPDDFRPPPPPMDRTWIHPSELGPNLRPEPQLPPRTRTGWRATLLGVGIVALVAGAGLLVVQTDAVVGDRTRLGTISAGSTATSERDDRGVVNIEVRVDPATPPVRGTGIAMGSGTIVTSAALIGTASDIRISGRPAAVLARDPQTDLAVLRSDVQVTPAMLASSAGPRAGDRLALYTGAANATGTVRTTHATFAMPGTPSAPPGRVVSGLVETDIPPTVAATGSAATDRNGSIVGIVSGLRNNTAGVYVIPIHVVRDVVDQVRRTGTVRHGWFGLSVSDRADGAVVQEIATDGPAYRADIRVDDTIVAVDAEPTPNAGALLAAARSAVPGTAITVQIRRGGDIRSVTLVTGTAPADS